MAWISPRVDEIAMSARSAGRGTDEGDRRSHADQCLAASGRRAAMEELTSALPAILDAAPAPMAVLDDALRVVFVNARMVELGALGGDPSGRLAPEIAPALAAALEPHRAPVLERGEIREILLGRGDAAHPAAFFRVVSPRGERFLVLALRERDDLLARLRFEEMLAHLASRFVDVTAAELDEVLAASLATIGDALGADHVTVHELAAESGVRISVWNRDPSLAARPGEEQVPVAHFPWSTRELLAGRMILAHSADELPPEAEAEREAARTRPGAFATAPLRVGAQALGAMTVRWVEAKPDWTPSLRARLGLVAQLVSTALHRRTIEREAEEGRRFDAFLARISTGLIEAEGDRLDEAIREALRALAHHRGLDRAQVRDLDALTNGRSPRVYEWASPEAPDARDEPLDALPLVAAELSAGRAFVVRGLHDLPPHAERERRWFEATGVASQAIVPLRVGEELVGALRLDAIAPARLWSGPFLARMQLASEIFANALHRRQVERSRAERQRFDELLGEVSTALVDAPAERLDEVLRDALERVRDRLDLVRAVVIEIDRAEGTFRIVQQAGPPGPYAARAAGPVFPLLLDRMIDERFSLLSTDEIPDQAAREAWRALGIRVAATTMLSREGRSLGMLVMLGRDLTVFRDDFAGRMRLLQDVLGSALARREAELERRRAFDELAQLKARIERERDYLREEVRLDHDVHAMVVESPALARVLEIVDAVTSTTATVLIRGETGVGKELIARAIHARSPRADAPLVKVNCASIPRDLFESEFFGHVRGSFTGAHRDRAGRFELADKGTIFLDEVGEIPIELQAKLLRVLQEGEIERIGDDRARRVDVRIIAATNRDLEEDIASGRFRRDLYYRLSVFPIDVPPLRARPEDIVPLARHYVARFSKKMGRAGLELSRADEEMLLAYPWPGNVRELAHAIERAVILSVRPPLRLDLALPRAGRARVPAEPRPIATTGAAGAGGVRTEDEMRELERLNLITALERAGGRVGGRGGAAELLGVSPSTLRDRMRAFGIETPRVRSKPQ